MNDWSPHLQRLVLLERHAHDALNERNYFEAEDYLVDMIAETASALAWVRNNYQKDRALEEAIHLGVLK